MESVDSSGSVITDYQYEKNIFSDPRFLRDHLTRTEEQKETVRIVADGGYVGQECRELAAEKNIELINTALKGVAVPDIYGGFLLSDNGKSAAMSSRICANTLLLHRKNVPNQGLL